MVHQTHLPSATYFLQSGRPAHGTKSAPGSPTLGRRRDYLNPYPIPYFSQASDRAGAAYGREGGHVLKSANGTPVLPRRGVRFPEHDSYVVPRADITAAAQPSVAKDSSPAIYGIPSSGTTSGTQTPSRPQSPELHTVPRSTLQMGGCQAQLDTTRTYSMPTMKESLNGLDFLAMACDRYSMQTGPGDAADTTSAEDMWRPW